MFNEMPHKYFSETLSESQKPLNYYNINEIQILGFYIKHNEIQMQI